MAAPTGGGIYVKLYPIKRFMFKIPAFSMFTKKCLTAFQYWASQGNLKINISINNIFANGRKTPKIQQCFGSEMIMIIQVKSKQLHTLRENQAKFKNPQAFWRTLLFWPFFGGFLAWFWGETNIYRKSSINFDFGRLVPKYIQKLCKPLYNYSISANTQIKESFVRDSKQVFYYPCCDDLLDINFLLIYLQYETGWRFKKRPGVDFLLQHCAPPLFEIVIYTYEQGLTAFPLIDNLDPNGNIWYRLFKDSTRYVDGIHQKDLLRLNRDLDKVIMIDWDENAVTSKRNQLKLKRWDGDIADQTLIDLGIMLRTIAESEVSDVREVLDYYRSFDDPLAAFKENQRAAAEQELLLRQKAEEDRKRGQVLTGSWSSSFLRRR
ncbi:unnamed protein product, partial [Meganyctiphanes norvegica]